jgi:hypothetical protein
LSRSRCLGSRAEYVGVFGLGRGFGRCYMREEKGIGFGYERHLDLLMGLIASVVGITARHVVDNARHYKRAVK